ncbi:hypothetical protein M8J76_011458 [Diaphorina citri]|nr:hypothetical protein M8J76_011458 [Diaphorina citri]
MSYQTKLTVADGGDLFCPSSAALGKRLKCTYTPVYRHPHTIANKMSTSTRAANRGGTKSSKQTSSENHKNTSDTVSKSNTGDNTNSKAHKNDTGKALKNNTAGGKQAQVKPAAVPTAEQLRLARLIKPGDSTEDPELSVKICMVMDASRKSEEAVCAALAENDEDVDRAVEALLESDDFEFTSVKKKKNKAVPNAKGESGKDKGNKVGDEELNHVNSSNGGGSFERRGRGRGRGGSTTDRGGRPYRSRENKENERSGGPDEYSSGPGGDRPRRGGPGGPRMSNGPSRFGARGGRGGGRGGAGPRTYSSRQDRDGFPKSIDTWNNPGSEEQVAPAKMETWGEFPSPEDWDNEEYTGSLADSKVFTPSSANDALPNTTSEDAIPADTLNASFNSTEAPVESSTVAPTSNNTTVEELRPPSPVTMSSTLTAAQSQYLSQLTQQAQSQASQPSYAAVSSPSTPVSYTTGTEFVNSYSTTLNDIGNTQQVLPQRSKAPRTRVPPPSKIPASAVEMPPGDTSGSAGLGTIDVQFGALDFGSEPSAFESPADTGVGVQTMPKYSSQATDPIAEHSYVSSTSLAAAASQLKNNHASLTSSLSKSTGAESLLSGDSSYGTGRNTTFQELANMASKAAQDSYDTSSFPQPSASSLYQSKTPAASAYPPSSTPYASQAYSTSSNVYSSSSGGYAASMSNGSYSNSQYNSSYVPSGYPGAYSTQSYQQPGSTGSNSYGGGQQSSGQSYPYNNVSSLGGASSGYNSYQTSSSNPLSHKLSSAGSLSKDSQYESIPPGLSSLTQTSISSSSSSASNVQNKTGGVGASGSVSSSNPASSNKSNVASIPPGVAAPVVGTQYIMSSTGLPYVYNQPPMYNFEDLQLMPNRIPHAYYDLGFPPTSMGGRGEPSVAAYSTMSDARFARTDNNASPVPSSLSTQNATQAPLLNPPLPYAYYYSTVNAGGYASTQPASTGTGKTSGAGSQVSGVGPTPSPQQQASASSADLMYSKSQHASLAKVNSYDKATFHHTGTPPPYTLTGVGNAVGGMGPTGAFAAAQHSYPPVIVPSGPPHHSTTLMHQPHLQMDLRTSQTRRTDSSGNSTSRSQAGSQVNKPSSKNYYGNWNQN